MASQNAVARSPSRQLAAEEGGNPLVALRTQLENRSDEFKMVLPGHITPEKFQRTVLTAVQGDPDILTADRRSLLTACMKAAQDGLLPDKREAALVIFNTRQKIDNQWKSVKLVQYMPMVYGLRKKILQSGEIKDIQANVVYLQEIDAGLFVYEEGTERMLRHKPLLDPTFEPKDEDIVAAYSIATFKDGTMSFEVMRRYEINKVREKSQTGATKGRDGNPRESSGPWVEWFSEMAKKSVMRRHSKTLPMSGDILDVEAIDDAFAARSTTAVLGAVQADDPITLPTRGDGVLIEGGTSGGDYDPETGEVLDHGSGGEQPPTWDEASEALKACNSVDDVNATLKQLRPHFNGDDLEDLNMEGAARIDALLREPAE